VIGIVATSAYRVEKNLVLAPNGKIEIAGYAVTFKGSTQARGPNYIEQVGRFDVSVAGDAVTTVAPAKRIYSVPRQATTEAGIYASPWGDLYVVLGDRQADQKSYAIRIYFNPLVRLIWIGALIMFLGGLMSLTDRRLRVGAPRRARKPATTAAAQPAE